MHTPVILTKAFFISLFSFTALWAGAQKKKKTEQDHERFFRLGAIAAANINSIDGKSFTKDYRFNYQLGAFILINPITRIGIQPEVHFAQSTSTYSDDAGQIYDDLRSGNNQVKAKMDVIKLIGLVNVDIGSSQRVKWQVGPQWSMIINQNTGIEGNANEIFKKGDFSGVTGIWIQLPFVFIGARYEHGFTNLNNIDNRDTWRSRAFQVMAGVTF